MPQVKCVIFDYGGVICKLPGQEQIQQFAAACGLSQADFLKHFWHYRLAYDRGDLDGALFWKSIAKSAGVQYTDEQIQTFVEMDVRLWLEIDQPILEWNRMLREAGIRTAILSNMPDVLGEHLRRHSDLYSQFDAVTLSYEVRSAKPESKIYRSCLAQLGIRAGDAIFLDDKPVNVHAAQAVGLHAVVYKSRADFAVREQQFGLPAIPTH